MEDKKEKEVVLLEHSLSLSSHPGLTPGGMCTAVSQFRGRNPYISGKNIKIIGLPAVNSLLRGKT